ncbi:MAG: pyridoxal phosphate-dependent aminotransferase, partial [Nitrospinota bacterium]
NGLFCDGSETCDPALDCQAGTPPTIDDGVGCTDDSCDEVGDVIVNSPNNPTGTIIRKGELQTFLRALPENLMVLLDEAYGDFVDDPDWPDSLALGGGRPFIVLRSFSKIYGLAGLRVGFGVGPEDLIGYMNRTREPFNVNRLAQAAAAAALGDEGYRRRAIEVVRRGRSDLYAAFDRLGLRYLESQANFIFLRVEEGDAVFEELMRRGVIVRPGSAFDCPEWVRVTVGLPEENRKLVEALEKVGETGAEGPGERPIHLE